MQFQCSRCDAIQAQSKSIVRHMEEMHGGFQRYTCALCGRQTHAVHLQLSHWNLVHADEIGSKESLVVYSRHLSLREMSPEAFERAVVDRPKETPPTLSTLYGTKPGHL